jgi:hypothetical protein
MILLPLGAVRVREQPVCQASHGSSQAFIGRSACYRAQPAFMRRAQAVDLRVGCAGTLDQCFSDTCVRPLADRIRLFVRTGEQGSGVLNRLLHRSFGISLGAKHGFDRAGIAASLVDSSAQSRSRTQSFCSSAEISA